VVTELDDPTLIIKKPPLNTILSQFHPPPTSKTDYRKLECSSSDASSPLSKDLISQEMFPLDYSNHVILFLV
jgi:hypothetical protein